MKQIIKKVFLKINYLFRLLLAALRIFSARLKGERFHCRSLAGKSQGNLAINSDLSVSCNCYDVNGKGQIGNLAKNSLDEILSGEKAKKFRKKLSKGFFPILDCVRCQDLVNIPRKEIGKCLDDYQAPNNLMVENTSACNLNCLSCNRKAIYKHRKKLKMSLEDIELVAKTLRDNKVEKIYYFNWGEPFCSDNIKKEIEIIRKYNSDIYIEINTNGNLINTREKQEAALLMDHIIISLDGASNEKVKKYQVGSSFDKVYKNIKELIELRNSQGLVKPIIEWKYIIFRWNDAEEERQKATELAKKAGIDRISFWYTVSPLYGISWRYFLKYFIKTGKKEEIVIKK